MSKEIQEFIGIIAQTIGEFRGEVPSVETAPDIDIMALTGGEEKPFFVTLPIGEANVKSDNERFYDDAYLQSLQEQVNSKRPGGNMGHIAPEQRGTAFPVADAYWVGATRHGNKLFGKAYIPNGPVRDHLKRLIATGSSIATSVYGTGETILDKGRGAHRVTNFNLEKIDFAPPERAGIKSLAAVPVLTSEMEGENQVGEQQQPIQEIEALITEREGLKNQVAEMQTALDTQTAFIAELCGVVGVEKPEEIKGVVAEFINARNKAVETARQAVAAKVIGEQLSKLPDTAALVAEYLGTPDTDDEAKIKEQIAELMQRPLVKRIAESERFKLGGGRAIVGEQAPTNGGFREEAIANAANHAAQIGIQVKK